MLFGIACCVCGFNLNCSFCAVEAHHLCNRSPPATPVAQQILMDMRKNKDAKQEVQREAKQQAKEAAKQDTKEETQMGDGDKCGAQHRRCHGARIGWGALAAVRRQRWREVGRLCLQRCRRAVDRPR